MKTFVLKTDICQFESVKEFVEKEPMKNTDLILTNRFLYENSFAGCGGEAAVIFQEEYGNGEPTDDMIARIKADMPPGTQRIIAVGGGTVIDIAKFLCLDSEGSVDAVIMKEVPYRKARSLYVIPTTCGTGSEVTNVAIAELLQRKTKKGLADDMLYPDKAVLIPEMVESLPYRFFATSSIDALIHAVESYLSPKADMYSEMFSVQAIRMILDGYQRTVCDRADSWKRDAKEFLLASNLAGIAFGNAGCAAVHALSYPLGGTYHIPHGEANQLMFEAVLRMYEKKAPEGKLHKLKGVLAACMNVETEQGMEALFRLMEQILPRKPLKEYGIQEAELAEFVERVIEGQQRLLNNNYTLLDAQEMLAIYQSVYAD